MRDINVAGTLCKNIFSVSENSATRKPNNSNTKNSINYNRSCLDNNIIIT